MPVEALDFIPLPTYRRLIAKRSRLHRTIFRLFEGLSGARLSMIGLMLAIDQDSSLASAIRPVVILVVVILAAIAMTRIPKARNLDLQTCR